MAVPNRPARSTGTKTTPLVIAPVLGVKYDSRIPGHVMARLRHVILLWRFIGETLGLYKPQAPFAVHHQSVHIYIEGDVANVIATALAEVFEQYAHWLADYTALARTLRLSDADDSSHPTDESGGDIAQRLRNLSLDQLPSGRNIVSTFLGFVRAHARSCAVDVGYVDPRGVHHSIRIPSRAEVDEIQRADRSLFRATDHRHDIVCVQRGRLLTGHDGSDVLVLGIEPGCGGWEGQTIEFEAVEPERVAKLVREPQR